MVDRKEIKNIAKEIAKEAVQELIGEQKDKRLHNTRLLVKNYLALKKHVENVKDDIKIDLNLLEEENCKINNIWIMSIARSKTRTSKMIAYLESAIDIVENEFKQSKEEYKYKAFKLYYIENEIYSDIVAELGCSPNSPRKWANMVIERLNVLLWGIDALGI
ncbi:MAG: hypothetical protein ACLT0R_16430 [Paraclostridium sordellii]|uniref:hypothetical protein n=1 Tax=Paraclostridium sordellii TaxID=1505 RepID=UPI0005DAF186|nr:hypothetical protein [Paeniclostridium sordellii]CEQ00538.1 sigma-70 region 4 type 2 [[Clostridium] sordellii] [Paeniclostridium sordellii]